MQVPVLRARRAHRRPTKGPPKRHLLRSHAVSRHRRVLRLEEAEVQQGAHLGREETEGRSKKIRFPSHFIPLKDLQRTISGVAEA